jgi:hypothetical protein
MSVISDLTSGAASGIFSGLGSMAKDLREAFVGKEMTPELQVELQKKVMDLELAVTNSQMTMIAAEASSSDPWTSRARPSFMYVFYFMLLFIGITAPVIGIWYPQHMTTFFANVQLGLAAIPDSLYTLFGAGYLGYATARTVEKKAGVSK